MTPREVSEGLVRETDVLREEATVAEAARRLLEVDLPALPVVDRRGCLTGLFGEREFMTALFPGYVRELGGAAFVGARLDEALEKRLACRNEPISQHMNTENIELDEDFSDVGVAETFLHHRVLVVPVVRRDGSVAGVITRSDFFARLARRFVDAS